LILPLTKPTSSVVTVPPLAIKSFSTITL